MVATALINGSLPTGSPTSAVVTSTEASIPGNLTETIESRDHSLDKQAKIGIGVAIPVAVTALVLLIVLLWRRSRKIKESDGLKEENAVPEDNQPYLQQKAELEAEEKRKNELEAEEKRYELDGETRIHEMSDEGSHGLPYPNVMQELRGEEHSRELEVP